MAPVIPAGALQLCAQVLGSLGDSPMEHGDRGTLATPRMRQRVSEV